MLKIMTNLFSFFYVGCGGHGSELLPHSVSRDSHRNRWQWTIDARRCGGLVVRVLATRSPVPGSILGPGPPHSVIWGAADHTVILYKIKYNFLVWCNSKILITPLTLIKGALEEKSRCNSQVLFLFFAIFTLKMKLFWSFYKIQKEWSYNLWPISDF